jgi:hypothetical protein
MEQVVACCASVRACLSTTAQRRRWVYSPVFKWIPMIWWFFCTYSNIFLSPIVLTSQPASQASTQPHGMMPRLASSAPNGCTDAHARSALLDFLIDVSIKSNDRSRRRLSAATLNDTRLRRQFVGSCRSTGREGREEQASRRPISPRTQPQRQGKKSLAVLL